VFTPSSFPALGPRCLAIFGCMFAIALFGVACGSSQAQKASQSSPPTTQTGTLSVSSNSLQFNTVVVGQNATQNLQLSNQGAGAVQVTALSISNSQFSIGGASVPFTVNPSSSVSLTVTFAPTSSGSASGMLSISSNASNPQVTVSLAGTGENPPPPAYTVQLTWDASTSQVVGYIVLRGETSGGPYTPLFATALNALSYTDATVASGATYYYVVTAIGETGIESGLSNQVTVVIP
jgi:hypothetical protein